MSHIIGILNDRQTGGTFLNWTIHYLAGHTKTYDFKKQSWVDLMDNPLTKINAHLFWPNQANTLSEYHSIFKNLTDTHTDLFHTIYFHDFLTDRNSTNDALTHTKNNLKKGIILLAGKNNFLYHVKYTPRTKRTHDSPDKSFNELVDNYFFDSKEKWFNAGLTNIWDKREFIALNVDPTKIVYMDDIVINDNNYYLLNSIDLYNTFDTTVYDLFNYLDLTVNEDRYENWSLIYNQWKKLHYQNLRFLWYFDLIIESILAGKTMDLQSFNLDIRQEAAIQRELIYKHSLNLKTWQLEKFIDTKQLHDLLEPNTHLL